MNQINAHNSGSGNSISMKSQASDHSLQIVAGRVVYDAGSIILEESKDISDISHSSINRSL